MAVKQMIIEHLEQLREELRERGIDIYLVPTADFHNSEYVSDYFKVREFLSGFSGSNGTLIISAHEVGLWTDGRYFIQAERELQGSGIKLFRMGEEGVPSMTEYLERHLQEGDTLGFDGRVLEASFGIRLEKQFAKLGVQLYYREDVAGCVWRDRPSFPCGHIWVVQEELAGRSVADKLKKVWEMVKKTGADGFLLSRLDDVMWLFNLRGSDIPCNPVALSYAYLEEDKAVLFVQRKAVGEELKRDCAQNHITLMDYDRVSEYLEGLPQGKRVLLDEEQCSYALYSAVRKSSAIIKGENPTEMLKAVKNETELALMREVYLKDSAALVRFLYWLKHTAGKGKEEITEYSAGRYLEGLRQKMQGFLDFSFPTISAYRENAAMMHYEAPKEGSAVLKQEGMLLVDSGGQYLGGTTDVTRTIALGELTQEEKRDFTAVASGMLQLSDARFLYGCTGRNLDILARGPIWDMDMDYKCGTGHGVGCMLNVHEGPQNIRWRYQPGVREAILEEGMIVTNEPGIYREGQYGIRTENVLAVRKGTKNGDGQFMYFETLTWVPIDLEAIDPVSMTDENIAKLNLYHEKVYEKIAPLLEKEEADWLRAVTLPVKKERYIIDFS